MTPVAVDGIGTGELVILFFMLLVAPRVASGAGLSGAVVPGAVSPGSADAEAAEVAR